MHGRARHLISQHLKPISSLPECRVRGKHNKSKNRAGRPAYELFEAINDACLPCVRRTLETVNGVSPDVASDTHHWNIRDYANSAASTDVAGAADVLHYLQRYWSHIVGNHNSGT